MADLNDRYDIECEKLEREYNRRLNRARIEAGEPRRQFPW